MTFTASNKKKKFARLTDTGWKHPRKLCQAKIRTINQASTERKQRSTKLVWNENILLQQTDRWHTMHALKFESVSYHVSVLVEGCKMRMKKNYNIIGPKIL